MIPQIEYLMFTYIVSCEVINFIIDIQRFFSIYNSIWSIF